jgi:hypothetical protein
MRRMVTELSKRIKVSEEGDETMAGYFPSLLWMVRDFHLELVDEDGSPITNDEYLESALKEQTGYSKEIMERNKIRTLLKSYFKERHCFTIVRPAHDEKDLQSLSSNVTKTRGIFEQQLQEARTLLFNTMKAKAIGEAPMTGKAYLTFIQTIITALNEGAVTVAMMNSRCRR